jgi:hypothetical protein
LGIEKRKQETVNKWKIKKPEKYYMNIEEKRAKKNRKVVQEGQISNL